MPNKKPLTVSVSGGFDPVHIGHVRMFERAKKLGTRLVVIINNDNWLIAKKGFVFMPEHERAELIRAFRSVDDVLLTSHKQHDPDRSVVRELRKLRPDIFANGGDRKSAKDIPEARLCKELGIRMAFNAGKGGKVQSSSWLTNTVFQRGKVAERPWGSMETFINTRSWWLKRLTIHAGVRTSLQKHAHRAETWMCVEGDIEAEVNGKTKKLLPGDLVRFTTNVVHRISSKKGGILIEVAHGKLTVEGDITRISDDFGRK
jgi:cytidyltransferase-like protein